MFDLKTYSEDLDLASRILLENVAQATRIIKWPDEYIHAESGRIYRPHNAQEEVFVYADEPKFMLIRGGEGSGKSVALIIKILDRLRRGMSGAVLSPNLPSFKRSLFPELLRWLPRSVVIDTHQRYFNAGWVPRESFTIIVHNELGGHSKLFCAGAESPRLLEGPNWNFVAMDEIRGMPNDEIFKVMQGRVRIPGPNGEPSQIFCSSTPAMHWMFDRFGPPDPNRDSPEMAAFKKMTYVAVVTTAENEAAGNIEGGFVEARGVGLTEEEKLVRLSGEWVNEDNPMRFIPDMIQWDVLRDANLKSTRKKDDANRDWSDAMVLAIDASVSRDHTALIGVTRHPNNRKNVAVRLVKVWNPKATGMIDFRAVRNFIIDVCKTYHVLILVYDDFQMENMAQSLWQDGIVGVKKFSQQSLRTLADQYLFDSIFLGKLSHMGDTTLREHLDNANVKIDPEQHKKRIIKRNDSMKIDATVALSMANYECSRLNI